MRFVVLDAFEGDRLAFIVKTHFYFRKIEIERAALKTFLSERAGQIPGSLDPPSQLVSSGRFQNRVGLFVGKAMGAPNYTAREPHLLDVGVRVELNKNG